MNLTIDHKRVLPSRRTSFKKTKMILNRPIKMFIVIDGSGDALFHEASRLNLIRHISDEAPR